MSDELQQRLMPAIIVFNFTVAAWMVVKTVYPMLMLNKLVLLNEFLLNLLIGAGVGLITGGVTLGVTLLLKK